MMLLASVQRQLSQYTDDTQTTLIVPSQTATVMRSILTTTMHIFTVKAEAYEVVRHRRASILCLMISSAYSHTDVGSCDVNVTVTVCLMVWCCWAEALPAQHPLQTSWLLQQQWTAWSRSPGYAQWWAGSGGRHLPLTQSRTLRCPSLLQMSAACSCGKADEPSQHSQAGNYPDR